MIMKITEKKRDWVNFKDIPVGQTFRDVDGEICLRIETTDSGHNAISLSLNRAYEFKENNLVTPVNVELIVDGEGV
jgi:hypothetical protein